MRAYAHVVKTDNGFNALLLDATHPYVFNPSPKLFNRHFKGYAKGDYIEVGLNISATGRRVVKYHIKIEGDFTPYSYVAPVVEEVVKEKPVRKPRVKPKGGVEGYYISNEARLTFTTAKRMSDTQPERAVKIMMVGPSGYGKTTLPRLFADVTGMNFLRMNCATIRDPEEWFGYREAREGSTVFIRSEFIKAVERGNLVVVLDEFNRLEPWLHNTLFPLLDDDGATVVHDEQFRVGPNVIVVGTINVGYRYTGVFELDEALLNRFEFILEVGPMPHAEEVKVLVARTGVEKDAATAIVKMSNTLRQNDIVCSTRTSLLVANMLVSGMTIREAFDSAVVRRIPSDTGGNSLRKSVVDLINVGLGTLDARIVEGDVFAPEGKGSADNVTITHTLTLVRSEGATVGIVALITLLRKLDVVEVGQLSIRKSQELAEKVSEGETITLSLNEKPEGFEELAQSFRKAGVGGRYTAR